LIQNSSFLCKRFAFITLVVGIAVCALNSRAVLAADMMGREEGVTNTTPKILDGVGVVEHLGETINLDLKFQNEQGETVPLRSYFKNQKPVILSLAYYNCPGLCNFHLNGLKDVFKQLKWTVGQEFNFLVVSFDPKEKPPLALAKKENYLASYGRPEGASGWHLLTGDEAAINELAREVGFKFKWDEAAKQYAHASVAYVLTPDGHLSRYLYGIDFDPKTVRLSLVEASQGHVGNIVDSFVLYCFHYDPKASKYVLAAINIMRAGGILIVLVLAAFLAPYWIRQKRLQGNLQRELQKTLKGEG
jgi:protein SCO1/2